MKNIKYKSTQKTINHRGATKMTDTANRISILVRSVRIYNNHIFTYLHTVLRHYSGVCNKLHKMTISFSNII